MTVLLKPACGVRFRGEVAHNVVMNDDRAKVKENLKKPLDGVHALEPRSKGDLTMARPFAMAGATDAEALAVLQPRRSLRIKPSSFDQLVSDNAL